MGMLQPGGELDLAEEAVRPQCGREVGMEDLERDRTVVPEVAGQKDRGHAPTAELALDRVPVAQSVAQQGQRVYVGVRRRDTLRYGESPR